MRLPPQIKPIQQPVEFLHRESHGRPLQLPRPDKTLPLETLVPQTKPIALPVQQFDPVTITVREHIQCVREGIQSQGLLDQHGKTGNGLAKINRLATQIHRPGIRPGPHHGRSLKRCDSCANHRGSGQLLHRTCTRAPTCTVTPSPPPTSLAVTRTAAKLTGAAPGLSTSDTPLRLNSARQRYSASLSTCATRAYSASVMPCTLAARRCSSQ